MAAGITARDSLISTFTVTLRLFFPYGWHCILAASTVFRLLSISCKGLGHTIKVVRCTLAPVGGAFRGCHSEGVSRDVGQYTLCYVGDVGLKAHHAAATVFVCQPAGGRRAYQDLHLRWGARIGRM